MIFRDTYAVPMSEKRKAHEGLKTGRQQFEIARSNRLYRKYNSMKSAYDSAKENCENRVIRNDERLISLRNIDGQIKRQINDAIAASNILVSDTNSARTCYNGIDSTSTDTSTGLLSALDGISTSSCTASGPFSGIATDITSAKATISAHIASADTDMDDLHTAVNGSSQVSTMSGGIDSLTTAIGGGSTLGAAQTQLDALVTSMTGNDQTSTAQATLQQMSDDITGGTITDTGTLSGQLNTLQTNFGTEFNSMVDDLDTARGQIGGSSDTEDIGNANTSLGTAKSNLGATTHMSGFTSDLTAGETAMTQHDSNVVTAMQSFKDDQTTTFDDFQTDQLREMIKEQNGILGPYDAYQALKNGVDPFDAIDDAIKANFIGDPNRTNFAAITGFQGNKALLDNPPANSTGGLTKRLDDIGDEISELENYDCETALAAKIRALEIAEFEMVGSLIEDNQKVNGKNDKLNPAKIIIKYKAMKALNPNITLMSVFEREIRDNPTKLNKLKRSINRAATKVNKFTDIIEGRPDMNEARQVLRNPYSILDPQVCGLVALDNDGSVLNNKDYNIPFQYVDINEVKESKSANYEEVSPIGRFESHRSYGGAGAMQIAFDVGYMAFESGPESDEGFVQEVKDRWLAALYPIYGKNHRSGVRTYGTPNKYLLNMFKRFINIPVIVKEVSFENKGGTDPDLWYSMGFLISITLETSYRLSRVVSADDVITKGISAHSHKAF